MALALFVLFALPLAPAFAQKLPSPERIVGDYAKAVGGRKRLAAVRDATYEFSVRDDTGAESRARMLTKAPSSVRAELHTGGVEVISASNGRLAWTRDPVSGVQTLTGVEAHTAKLQAMLGAGRMLDFKKKGVLARTVGVEQVGGEQAFVVEFSRREGGRVRHWFGTTSKLLLKSANPLDAGAYLYDDYRPAAAGGVLEPHRSAHVTNGKTDATYTLQSVRYNTGLADSLFDPPAEAGLDVSALLRELARNQKETDERVNDYTFTRKVTEREVNDRGELKKETVNVYEVYPVADHGWVLKHVAENGAPLAPERAAKEEKRVAAELAKAEREAPKRAEKRERERARRDAKRRQVAKGDGEIDDAEGDDVGISTFLRVCEFISPRRERFGGRDTIVFDFRPRPGYKPASRGESIVSKLAGAIWIDPAEHQVMRLDGRLIDDIKVGGGLVASVKPGSAFVFEQARTAEGVWLPRFAQVNLSAKVFLFAGLTVNETHEYDDYKLFSTKSGDAALDAPKGKP
ncbi:MAG TPA: hypothetical protein VF240_04275 [Pyrinomonadaceae bacterium]